MKLNLSSIPWIILSAVLLIVLLYRECGRQECTETVKEVVVRDTVTTVDTLFSTLSYVPKADKVLQPKQKEVDKAKSQTSKSLATDNVDTVQTVDTVKQTSANCCWRYLATKYYSDNLYNPDSTFKLTISDTVNKNTITGRSVEFQDFEENQIVTKTVTNTVKEKEPLARFEVGLSAGGGNGNFVASPDIGLRFRNGFYLGGGVQIVNTDLYYIGRVSYTFGE